MPFNTLRIIKAKIKLYVIIELLTIGLIIYLFQNIASSYVSYLAIGCSSLMLSLCLVSDIQELDMSSSRIEFEYMYISMRKIVFNRVVSLTLTSYMISFISVYVTFNEELIIFKLIVMFVLLCVANFYFWYIFNVIKSPITKNFLRVLLSVPILFSFYTNVIFIQIIIIIIISILCCFLYRNLDRYVQ